MKAESNLRAGADTAPHYDSFDLLKAIAIFLMVLFHYNNLNISIMEDGTARAYAQYGASAFFCLCVPILFFVNGALLLSRPFSLERHIKKTGWLVVLTCIWAVVTLAVLEWINGETFSLPAFLRDMWYWRQHYINHLWFLTTLTWIYLFLPLLLATKAQMPKGYRAFFLCVIVLVFGNSVLLYAANAAQYALNIRELQGTFNFFNAFNPFTGKFGFALGYFLLGGHLFSLGDRLDTRKARLLWAAVFALSMGLLIAYGVMMSRMQGKHYVIGTSEYSSFCFMLATAALYVLTRGYKARGLLGALVRLVGGNTLSVLFLHRIATVGLQRLFPALPFGDGLLANGLFALAITLLCALIGRFCRAVPGLRRLLSL